MYSKIGDIRSAVSSFQKDSVFVRLRNRWEDDFDLYRLKPYNAGEGYYSYTSNAPRVYADKVISLLTGSKLFIRIPIEVLDDEQRRQASNTERFLYGALNLNDERLIALGLPPLKEQLAWYLGVRGSVYVRCYVYKDNKGNTVPAIDVYDPYNCAYGQGEKGLQWFACTRKLAKDQVADTWGISLTGDQYGLIDITDYWDEEKFGLIVQNNRWGEELKKHDLDYNPVYMVRAGAMPPVWQSNYYNTGIHVGESIFAPNRNIYPILNKTLSDHLTIVRRGVKPPIGYWSAGGKKTIDEDIYQVEKAATLSLDLQEEIKPIIEPTMPADTAPLLAMISGEIQRGSLPHTTYGELGFRLSGFAINQLQASIETVIQAPLTGMERAYQLICRSLLQQFVDGRFPPIHVRGRTSRNEIFGMPRLQTIKPSDLEGDWHPEIRLEPILPKDEAQRYIMANMAREGEMPLLSNESIRDILLGVEDTDLEQEKVDKEWAAALIVPRLYNAYLAALADGRQDIAENIRAELKRLLGQLGTPPGERGRKPVSAPSNLEAIAAGTPGVGAPAGETGVPPTVLPSEALGGMPGGAAAVQGRLM